jgi:hypothetical protein
VDAAEAWIIDEADADALEAHGRIPLPVGRELDPPRMTAITSILLPYLGQAMTSSSYTLARSRAQAFLPDGVLTWRCIGPPWA